MKKQVILKDQHGYVIEPRSKKVTMGNKTDKPLIEWLGDKMTVRIYLPASILLALFTFSSPIISPSDIGNEPKTPEPKIINSGMLPPITFKRFNPYKAEAIANGVYLRVRPDINAQKEAWLEFGHPLTVIDTTTRKSEVLIDNRLETDKWCKVIYIENGIKYEGWVFGSLIRPTKA